VSLEPSIFNPSTALPYTDTFLITGFEWTTVIAAIAHLDVTSLSANLVIITAGGTEAPPEINQFEPIDCTVIIDAEVAELPVIIVAGETIWIVLFNKSLAALEGRSIVVAVFSATG